MLISFNSYSQPPWKPGDGKPPWAGEPGDGRCFPPPCVPIDGGLWILLIGAAILGTMAVNKE